MIEYVIPKNIDDRILKRASHALSSGGLVAHPTDTSWHISCGFSSKQGMEKLKKLKGGVKDYTFTLIASGIAQFSHVSQINTAQYKMIHRLSPGPYVFVLEALKKLEKITGVKRQEVGVRIPDEPITLALIEALGEPLFSTTAGRSMSQSGWWEPSFAEENLFEMGWELEELPTVDIILDHGEPISKCLTTVLDLTGEGIEVIRQGVGKI